MSAINALVKGQSVYLFTDGAAYTETGEPQGTGSKVRILPQIPCALSSRGSTAVAGALALEINHAFASFDTLAAGIGEAVRRVYAHWEPQKEHAGASLFELVIVGISAAIGGPVILALFDYDRPEGAAFTPIRIGGLISPTDLEFEASLARDGIHPRDSAADPLAVGLAVTRAQRDRDWTTAEGVTMRGVGGFCQATIVHPDRVEAIILERWEEAA